MSLIRLEQEIPYEEAVAEVPAGDLVEINQQKIYVKDVGNGPALILLHGFASSSYSFREVIGPLARNHRVLAIDLNGFGLTERPSKPREYRFENQADLIRAIAEAKGIKQATMVGHSYGSAVSAVMAKRHPSFVEKVVLISPPSEFAERPPWYVRNGLGIRVAFFLIRALLSNPEKFHELSSKAFYRKEALPLEVSEMYRRSMLTEGLKKACYGYAKAFAAKGAGGVQYGEISQQVLLMVGERDEVVSPESCAEVAGLISSVEMVSIPECGHCPPEEKPDEVLKYVRAFLERS